MELINATKMQAGYTMGMEPSGRELLVVVVKGTFHLPKNGESPRLHEIQQPMVMADTFTDEPGLSAPVLEVDFAPRKHRCDVLFVGSAHAPGGKPVTRIPVGLKVGALTKSFAVVGPRTWRANTLSVSAGDPAPFVTQPISYDLAFGGVDNFHEDPDKHHAFMANPVGKGFHKHLNTSWVDGAPMPNTEELNNSITATDGNYQPMALGPVGRGWESRSRYAGTYDQNWQDNIFPFLPADFDERFYQAAPVDQQIDYLKGGEEIILANLTPEGKTIFQLPHIEMPVHFFLKQGGRVDMKGNLDTLMLAPDAGYFSMTWRATQPLKKNIFEIGQVLVGNQPPTWWRARQLGKTYYVSLAELARARRQNPL
ncbi:MAG: DUF2169 domain-containing protein [Pseudomonadota bacterium]